MAEKETANITLAVSTMTVADLFSQYPAVPEKPPCVFDITGIDKARLFQALYNAAEPVHAAWHDISIREAGRIVNGYMGNCCYMDGTEDFTVGGFDLGGDYNGVDDDGQFRGRRLNVKFEGDTLYACGYDEEHGEGAAMRATETLRAAIAQGYSPADDSQN